MGMGSLGKNAFWNGIKQVCAIIFPLISFTYCSRVLGTDGIGIYSFAQSIVSYVLLIATLGIPNYAIREGAAMKQDKDKLGVFFNEMFSISCITTLVAYFILFILLIFVEKLSDYRYVILIQSIQIILTMLGTDWINTVYEDFFYISIRYIIIQVIAIFFLLIFVREPSDLYIYTFISMMSAAGGNILNFWYLRKKKKVIVKFIFKINFLTHIVPIFILFCNSVATVIYLNSDITLLGIIRNDSEVGVYTVSSKIYSMMKALINAIIMVTMPRFSYFIASGQEKEYRRNLGKIVNFLFLLIYPTVLGMFFEADKILLLIAGKEYLSGNWVVRILSFALFFAVLAYFFWYSILMPNHKEKYFLISTIIAAVVNISLNFIFIPYLGIKGAALTTLFAEIIVCLMAAVFSFKTVRFHIDYKDVIEVIIAGFVMIFVCKILDYFIQNPIVAILFDIIIGCIVYLLMLLCMKNNSIYYFFNEKKR